MRKSYVVKSPINFANFGFFVRVGDILVHDAANGNKLTVYRNGEIVKAITQTALGMAALLKQGFVTELVTAATPAAPKAPEPPKKAVPIKPTKEELEVKRAKAVAKEVSVDELPESLRTEIKKKAKAAVVREDSPKEEAPIEPPKEEVEEL